MAKAARLLGGAVVALAFLLPLAAPAPAAAQDLQPGHLLTPLVPGGHLRLGFTPSFTSWDSRYEPDPATDGADAGEEPLGSLLTSPTGTGLFPGVDLLARELQALTGVEPSSLLLGETQGMVTQDVTRLDFSAHVGVFDWLTVGGTLPWVKTRTAVELAYRPALDANLGVTPAATDPDAVASYLQSLAGVADLAEARARDLCAGSGPGCDDAEALAGRVREFATSAARMYGASDFFLLAGTLPELAYRAAQEELAAALTAAGLTAPAAPVFSTEVVDRETFAELPRRANLGIRGFFPPGESLWQAGDLEVEAFVRVLDGEVRDSAAAAPRLAWTVALGALVRLPTGTVDDPDVFLDQGTGHAQQDLEGSAYAALRVGRRFSLRAMGRYGIQQAAERIVRVAPPAPLFAPVGTKRTVEWTPGAYLDLTVSPRFRISESLSFAADYRLFDKAEDEFLLPGVTPGDGVPDPAVRERGTAITLHQVAVGLRYSTLGLWRDGRTGAPAELSARVVHTVDGTGRAPRSTRAELAIRLFRRLWGG